MIRLLPRPHPAGLRARIRRWAPGILQRARCSRFRQDLQRLHDVLKDTPLAGHYWLRAGLLLGWAREKQILKHDCYDADFGYRRADRDRLLGTFPALQTAGFRPANIFRNNDGEATLYRFLRHGAKFEFFEMTEVGDEFEYFLYAVRPSQQMRCRLPGHGLSTVDFIERRWCIPARHEEQLEIMYGDWRVPDPDHHYTNSGAVIERTPWTGQTSWNLDQTPKVR